MFASSDTILFVDDGKLHTIFFVSRDKIRDCNHLLLSEDGWGCVIKTHEISAENFCYTKISWMRAVRDALDEIRLARRGPGAAKLSRAEKVDVLTDEQIQARNKVILDKHRGRHQSKSDAKEDGS